jgi:hypothetical protein
VAFVPNLWVVLRARFAWPALRLRYFDSQGRRRETAIEWSGPASAISSEDPALRWLSVAAAQLAGELPRDRPGPHNTGPVPLAVFLDLPPRQRLATLEESLMGLIASPDVDIDRIQFLRLSPGRWLRREPFRLPFRVLATDPYAFEMLEPMRNHHWRKETGVSEFGFEIDSAVEEVEGDLRGKPRDIVVTAAYPKLRAIVKRLPPEQRPRLIVSLMPEMGGEEFRDLPAGIAMLHAGDSPPWILESFLMGLVHDLPLHEALKAAQRLMAPPSVKTILMADPRTNHSLRIADALGYLKRESRRRQVSLWNGPDEIDAFLDRSNIATDAGYAAANLLSKVKANFPASAALGQIQRFAGLATRLPTDLSLFEQESTALLPLSLVEAERQGVMGAEAVLRRELAEITSDPGVQQLLRENQKREVDVALERVESDPVFEAVERDHTLKRRTEYQLRVHIGNRLPDSIMSGPSAPIDPLLPDPDDTQGHLLEVALQAKDFRLRPPSVQPLRLPMLGGSEPVYFRVRTPDRLGPAELRILIFHRNHLVQSFQLRALIGDDEKAMDGEVLSTSLEFSRTQEFANLDALGSRLLSLGVNQSGASNTHKLTLKGDGTMGELTLFPSTFKDSVAALREVLRKSVEHPKNPNWTRVYSPVKAGNAPPADVAETLRSLAKKGYDLYRSFFGKAANVSQSLRDALVKLRQQEDQKIQVVRFDSNFVFPWTLLYDFPLPEERYSIPSPDVCLGLTTSGSDCGHNGQDKVYCVKGFWGIRHYVEEMIGSGTTAAGNVERTGASGALRLVVEGQLKLTPDPAQSLTSDGRSGPTDADRLLDVLWNDADRPAVLIVVGHLKTDNTTNMFGR